MIEGVRRYHLERHESATGSWEVARFIPPSNLRPYLYGCWGYHEVADGHIRRRGFPSPKGTIIVDFGPAIRLIDTRDPKGTEYRETGFFAGIRDRPFEMEHAGVMYGMEIALTPLGASLFLSTRMETLTNEMIGFEDVLGHEGSAWTSQLYEGRGWPARFALLEQLIVERLSKAKPVPRGVAWAYRQIEESLGRVQIGALAKALGITHKHLIALFQRHLGMSPRRLARVMRFNRALTLLGAGDRRGIEVALDAGYHDQAHFIREFQEFAGKAPGHFVRDTMSALFDLQPPASVRVASVQTVAEAAVS
jgi:AraC-like DNA-binding protein